MIFVNKKWEHTKLNIMKNLISVLIFSLITNCLYAQDRIVTLTGDTIYCEVVYIVQGKMTMIPRGSKNESVIDMNILTRYQWLDKWYAVHTVPQDISSVVIKKPGNTKNFLHERTRMFVKEHLTGSVVILDDTTKGQVIISNILIHTVPTMSWNIEYTFKYSIKFLHRNDSVKFIFDLNPVSLGVRSYQNATGTTLSVISGSGPMYKEYTDKNSIYRNVDVTKEFPGMWKCGYGSEKFYIMSQEVRETQKGIISKYNSYLNVGFDEW